MMSSQLELLAFFIVELCLVEYKMLKFPPSLLAAAAIYTAQCSLYRLKQWTKTSEWLTNYPEDQLLWATLLFCFAITCILKYESSVFTADEFDNACQHRECSRLMVTLHEKAATGKLTGVYRKFNTSKFGHAAKAEPALFLLNNQ